ncbi:rCG44328, isoform CRA_b [Rattus norvegicus]|uniref:RCG44328, isoform CRA_b n=1 Tax=Rattus norvegicus TaxID=10116 RepID=A6KDE2_RAT|nr:rCG44328, isoform CRA_b [Rattus norvegicus]
MGTLCPVPALCRPSTRGQQRASDYAQIFTNKEQAEVAGVKPKHVLNTGSVQAATSRALWEGEARSRTHPWGQWRGCLSSSIRH